MRIVFQVVAVAGMMFAMAANSVSAQWPGNCGTGGHGGWQAHMQKVRANFYGGANCGRGINQQQAEELWGSYCYDDCTLFSGGGCGTGCNSGCGTGGGFGRTGCFGYGGCGSMQQCGGAGGCGLFAGRGGLFGSHGGRGGCGCDQGCGQGNCFGWPGSNCGCSAGSRCGGGLLTGGRHFRCHRGMHTFDQFNQCGCDHNAGCHAGNCGSRGRFFRFAVGHEYGCGEFNSCVGNSISSSCGCDGNYGVPTEATPAPQPLQGTHGTVGGGTIDPNASPSDHNN